MHVYKPPPVGGLDRVPVYTAGTGSTRATLFELDGVTPMPGNVLVADTSGNLPSFQCATSPVYVGTSGSRTTWQPNESGDPTPSAASGMPAPFVPGSGNAWGFGADMLVPQTVVRGASEGLAMGEALILDAANPWQTSLVDNVYMHWDPAQSDGPPNTKGFTVKQAGWYMAQMYFTLAAPNAGALNIGFDFGATPNPNPALIWDYDIPAGGGLNNSLVLPMYLGAGSQVHFGVHNQASASPNFVGDAVVNYAALFLSPLFPMVGLPA